MKLWWIMDRRALYNWALGPNCLGPDCSGPHCLGPTIRGPTVRGQLSGAQSALDRMVFGFGNTADLKLKAAKMQPVGRLQALLQNFHFLP